MTRLVCIRCGDAYAADELIWRCRCGGLLDLDFQPSFDLDKISSRKPNMWRYREAIPLENDEHILSFGEGFTPLLEVALEGRRVFIKQDHLFPTGSYKDRGAALLMSKAHELGVRRVVEDSSGNAGCAISAYCALGGIECAIYVPEDTAAGKLAQIRLYGAELNRIPGSREDTARAVWEAAQHTYYASHSWNPFFFHGTKTWAFEVCEQLGWKAPDAVVLPAGNGTLLLGAAIGFGELLRAGIIEKMPRIIAVQSANSAPLYQAFHQNLSEIPSIEKKDTLAEGIAIAAPVRGQQILQAVRRSSGDFLAVSEEEIKSALVEICRKGFYIEPTAAATIAGLKQYLQKERDAGVIVSVFTGHGLKTTEKMVKLT